MLLVAVYCTFSMTYMSLALLDDFECWAKECGVESVLRKSLKRSSQESKHILAYYTEALCRHDLGEWTRSTALIWEQQGREWI